MHRWTFLISVALLAIVQGAFAQHLILTNDDGWAVAQIRAQRDALVDAGFDVRLSMAFLFIGFTHCENRLFSLPRRKTNPGRDHPLQHLSHCPNHANSTHVLPVLLLRASMQATVRFPPLWPCPSTLMWLIFG